MEKGEDFFLRDNQAIEQNEALSEKSKRRLNRSKAENTVKAYDADWRDFMDWCAAHEKTPLPAEPEPGDAEETAEAECACEYRRAPRDRHFGKSYRGGL